ncbi:TlpA family protein disulfide reductase [Streptomyces montanisoli]|uniref:TlpA family protein disulfide reductase n=1 Tax=Streptomyces montanisoli TaxID=2798581 RepID=A0A940RTC4_9ACTN|nr:TlpA disulfide reductase family protein [Streptomyces montanisoli]MBP0456051.1 TlpA family protein disulfide reductase [Streptomyces montanisoli]
MSSRKTLVRRSALGVGVGALLLAGCGTGTTDAGGGSGTKGAAADPGSAAVTKYPVGKRPSAPTLSGTTITGKRLDTADWRGRVIVINVWGSWCAPCRAEAPGLHRIAQETRKLGVEFAGIDTRDNNPAGRAFEATYKIRYPSFADQDGRLVAHFNGIIPISAVPSTAVIDRHGRVAASIVGGVNYTTLRSVVTAAANEGKPKGTGK